MSYPTKNGRYSGTKASRVRVIDTNTGETTEYDPYSMCDLRHLGLHDRACGGDYEAPTVAVEPDTWLDHARVQRYTPCPECRADRGESCRSRTGSRLHHHRARWAKARRARRNGGGR